MSAAKPIGRELRECTYTVQTGRKELTPRQRRRAQNKANIATSHRVAAGVGRYGRLGRRFDRKDRRRLAAEGRAFVAWIRARKARQS